MNEIIGDGMIQCARCGGSGRAFVDGESVTCPVCGGSGQVLDADALWAEPAGTGSLLFDLAKGMVGGVLGGLTVLFLFALYAVVRWGGAEGTFYPFGIILSTGCIPALFVGMLSGVAARVVLRRRPGTKKNFIVGYIIGLVLTGMLIGWLLFDWMYPFLP